MTKRDKNGQKARNMSGKMIKRMIEIFEKRKRKKNFFRKIWNVPPRSNLKKKARARMAKIVRAIISKVLKSAGASQSPTWPRREIYK